MRVLIFDDNEFIRSLLAKIMEQRGYECFTFDDPAACPLYLSSDCQCPLGHACGDVILSDIQMLTVNGLAFVQNQVRKGCKIKNLALMSGTWSDDQLHLARQIGCKTFHKPFSVEEIHRWLDECERSTVPQRVLSDWFERHPRRTGQG